MALDLPVHGGDLAAAERRWGRPAQGWLDLSTGINPWPYPLPAFASEDWTRLPGSLADEALRRAAARRFGAPSPDNVLAAPGTSSLIRALPRCRAPGSVAILGPTYGEHERAWADAGHRVRRVEGLEQAEGADVVVAVNPNNPDGRVLSADSLLGMVGRCGLLVVDEAFADATPEMSVAPRLREGMVVLRSFGKFYGLAGLRLGFALAMPGLRHALAAQLGPWPVPGPALAVGRAALDDDSWFDATARRLDRAAARLDDILAHLGFSVLGGTSLFRLAAHPQAALLYDRLGRAGILVRAFAHRADVLRFGLPPHEEGEGRLGSLP